MPPVHASPDAPPVGTVYAIGRNYAKHVAELGNVRPQTPVVFLKALTTLRGCAAAPVAFPDETFDHECELALRIGRDVTAGAGVGWAAVDAVTVGIDLTRRGVQSACKERRIPWTPGKSFQGSAILGDWVPRSTFADPDSIAFTLSIHGEPRQHGAVSEMLFSVPELLAYIASLSPLQAGDVVFTGTPHGVGPMRVGDPFTLGLIAADGRTWAFPGQL